MTTTNTNTTTDNTVSALVAATKAKKASRRIALPKTKAMIRAEANATLMAKVAKGRQTRAQKIEESRAKGRKASDIVPMIPMLRRAQTTSEMTLVMICEAITAKCGDYPHWHTVKSDTHNAKFAYDTWMEIRKEFHQAAFFEGYAQKEHYERLLKKTQAELMSESTTRTKKSPDVVVRDGLKGFYKRLMKIDKPTEQQLVASRLIGEALRVAYKVDLSTLNV
jgi:hypothetical protein